MHTQFCWGNILENGHLEDKEGNGKIILKWIWRKYVVRMWIWWRWFRIVSFGRFFY